MSSVNNNNNINNNNDDDDDNNNNNNIQELCWTDRVTMYVGLSCTPACTTKSYMQECMMVSAKKGERTGKRLCVNEISFLLAPFSGYTIFKP